MLYRHLLYIEPMPVFFCVGPRALLIPSYITLHLHVSSAISDFTAGGPEDLQAPSTWDGLVNGQWTPLLGDKCNFLGMCFEPVGRLIGFVAKCSIGCSVSGTPKFYHSLSAMANFSTFAWSHVALVLM